MKILLLLLLPITSVAQTVMVSDYFETHDWNVSKQEWEFYQKTETLSFFEVNDAGNILTWAHSDISYTYYVTDHADDGVDYEFWLVGEDGDEVYMLGQPDEQTVKFMGWSEGEMYMLIFHIKSTN